MTRRHMCVERPSQFKSVTLLNLPVPASPFWFLNRYFFGFWSGRQSYEPPSKSIVDAWYENIDYRSLGGPYRFTVFYSNQHSIMQNAAELTSWIQISKQPGMDQGGARCLCVCNHVGELPKHIPGLFPKQGHLLHSQLQTRMTVTNIRSIILWKRKRISLWSNESIPRPGSLFQ